VVVYLPIGHQIFSTQPLTARDLAIALSAALALLVSVEAWKAIRRRRGRSTGS
jgi:hypothetical protein